MSEQGESRIAEISLDEESLAAANADIEHERRIAQFDLLEKNSFAIADLAGPYRLHLSVREQRLQMDVVGLYGGEERAIQLSLAAFRSLIKDYFLVCDSYFDAIRHATPTQIEAIDMGRRGLHNEGAELLVQRLKGKVDLDFDTARRLFTLICALHIRK
jgi:uncharacterized protein (UPF0262 family)